MSIGVSHYNYSWKDMTIPTVTLMMDIVHIAVNIISSGGKILVHCHAGFGRTGLAIACILIALDSLDSEEAINRVRQRRPGSIQTKEQYNFVFEFEKYYKKVIQVFPRAVDGELKSFSKSVSDQFFTLSYEELSDNKLMRISKLVNLIVPSLQQYSSSLSYQDRKDDVSNTIEYQIMHRNQQKIIDTVCSSILGYHHTEIMSSAFKTAVGASVINSVKNSDACLNFIKNDINNNNWSIVFCLCSIITSLKYNHNSIVNIEKNKDTMSFDSDISMNRDLSQSHRLTSIDSDININSIDNIDDLENQHLDTALTSRSNCVASARNSVNVSNSVDILPILQLFEVSCDQSYDYLYDYLYRLDNIFIHEFALEMTIKLLFEWFDTRSDVMFDSEHIDKFSSIWESFEDGSLSYMKYKTDEIVNSNNQWSINNTKCNTKSSSFSGLNFFTKKNSSPKMTRGLSTTVGVMTSYRSSSAVDNSVSFFTPNSRATSVGNMLKNVAGQDNCENMNSDVNHGVDNTIHDIKLIKNVSQCNEVIVAPVAVANQSKKFTRKDDSCGLSIGERLDFKCLNSELSKFKLSKVKLFHLECIINLLKSLQPVLGLDINGTSIVELIDSDPIIIPAVQSTTFVQSDFGKLSLYDMVLIRFSIAFVRGNVRDPSLLTPDG